MFCPIIRAKSLLFYKWLLSPEKALDLPEKLWRRMSIVLYSDLFVHIGGKKLLISNLL